MNHAFVMISFLGIAAVIDPGQETAMIQHDISVYLPTSGEVEGWEPVGSPQAFVGDGLYDLIDGGAVIYYEYGFKQVIVQKYQNADGKSINLEIYEMDNSASAYGIYTFQRGEGDEVEVGSEGIRSEYYLHFWKDNFFVTLIASDTEEYLSKGLLTIAKKVDHKITNKGRRPSLCNLLVIDGSAPPRIVYMKGNLALSNIYDFTIDDVFGLREGVVGRYGDFNVFVFKYNNEKESRSRYMNARDEMSTNPRFENFADHGDNCYMKDKQGAVIQMKLHRNYIFVYSGTGAMDPRSIFYKIENNLR